MSGNFSLIPSLYFQHSTPSVNGDEQMINYEGFLSVMNEAGPKCLQFFKPITYAKLFMKDPLGRISIMQFFNYVMRKVSLFLLKKRHV